VSWSLFASDYWVSSQYPMALIKLLFGCQIYQVSYRWLRCITILANKTRIVALSSLIAWISICACFVRFYRALKIQGIDRKNLDLRGWFQPYMAWICIVSFTVILFFNGFQSFIHKFSVSDFFACYITLPVVAFSLLGFRLYLWRTGKAYGLTNLDEINLGNGPAKALHGTRYDLGAP
jgi:amino acid transporter